MGTQTQTRNQDGIATGGRHYVEPGAFTRRVVNPMVAFLTRRGLSLFGARILAVRGCRSGEWREVPVNLLVHDGVDHLVAARGETQWVRNLRAAGGGTLRVGATTEPFVAVEVVDEQNKVAVLRAYLEQWKWEVGAFFEVGPDAADAELRAEATRHPVFRVDRRPAG